MRRPLLLFCVLVCASAHAQDKVKKTASGLQYEVLVAGKEGTNPKPGEKVRVHYTGWLENGTKFDSSHDKNRPYSFTVGTGVIRGWSLALPLMTVGSKYRFTIPWQLAYGARGRPPTIPAKANLIFEIELLAVMRAPPFTKPDPNRQKTTESGLKYEVLTEGKGEVPRPDQGVKLEFSVWNKAGKHILSTAVTEQHLSGMCNSIQMSRSREKFFAEALQLMRPGARYRFEVPPELCWGAQHISPAVPANSVTVWELSLVQINDVPAFVKPDQSKQTKLENGLAYEVLKEGTGKQPKRSDTVTVHYTGWLVDGTTFDSSYARGEPAQFPLGRVIRGWTEGVQLMKEGAIYRFEIPGGLAYGPTPPPGSSIPPNATLIFTIELLKIG